MSRVLRIERVELRPGRSELDQAFHGPKGYVLASPHHSSEERKQPRNEEYASTLDEAADLIEKRGYHIRMGKKPERQSLIEPAKVRIIRA